MAALDVGRQAAEACPFFGVDQLDSCNSNVVVTGGLVFSKVAIIVGFVDLVNDLVAEDDAVFWGVFVAAAVRVVDEVIADCI